VSGVSVCECVAGAQIMCYNERMACVSMAMIPTGILPSCMCMRACAARLPDSLALSPVAFSLSLFLSLSGCVCVCMCVCDGVYVEVCITLSRTPDKFMP
jgi:hypothetical protein